MGDEILEAIFKRRSIRKYTPQKVEHEKLVKLLQAAMAAPSAVNSQPWEFVVVTEDEVMDQLRKKLEFGKYNAPAAIVVCGSPRAGRNRFGELFWLQDCTAALENILIAAVGLGLGTVWIGVHPHQNVMAEVSAALGIPETVTPLGVVYVGYPAEEKPARTQYDPQRVHWNRYEKQS